ncbi:NifU-like protein [Fusobacterium gonidiaformans 3-1-5R]|uniref:NifU-like protein n=2 Tax=Fusobacterium TaxID=848 RepID=E5BI76_9FUSO|nr:MULTISPECIES: NifU family protein [Fusobacterium]EFS22199.1 NifU-like protein [Fusobacterium gonidiaformans 3-1-5R]KXA15786.1 NifU-like protein [Fusobacterium equinum]
MEEILELIGKEIQPSLQEHGGSLEIVLYEEEKQELQLRLMGQCCSCPHSIDTVENFIKVKLKEKFPKLKKISVNTGVSNELLEIAKNLLRKEDSIGKLERDL